MKFEIQRKEFAEAVAKVLPAIGKPNNRPVLSCVYIEASIDRVSVTSTDLDIGLRSIVKTPIDIEDSGSVCVDAKTLYKMLSGMEGDTVSVWRDEGRIFLKCGSTRYGLVYIQGDEFPPFPETQGNRMPLDMQIANALSLADVAAPEQEQRLYNAPAGILIAPSENGEGIDVVATDGHRMVHVPVDNLMWPFPEGARMVIPKRLVPLLNSISGESHVAADGNILSVSGDVSMFCRLIDATNFPQYRDNLTTAPKYTTTMDRDRLLHMLRRVSVTAYDYVALEFEPNKLGMSSENINVGAGSDSMDVEYDGPAMTIGVNQNYLSDFLCAIPDTTIRMYVTDAESIIWIVGDTLKGTFLMMPVRL